MDVISIITHELFTLKFLHSGYGSPRPDVLSSDLKVEPDEVTKRLFKNLGLGFGFFNDRIVCYVRSKKTAPPANEPQVPYLNFSGTERIRFLLTCTPNFLRKTQVDATGSEEVYRFRNTVNIGTNLFISQHEGTVNDDDLADVTVVQPEKLCFGVVDIFLNGTTASYAILDSLVTQQLQNPGYKIEFTSNI